MAREPEERPSSASIFASALAGGSPLSVSPRPAPTVTRPAPPAAAPLVAPARPASQAATLVAPATLADAPAAVSGGRPWPFLLAGGGALFAIALGVLVAREVREGGSGPTPTAPAVVVGPSIMAPASATVVRTVIASATATRTPTTAAPTRTAAAGTATPVRAFTLPTEPARTIPIPAGVDPQVREVVLAINRAGPAYISAVRGPDEGPLREIYTGKALEVYSAFVAQLRAAKQYEADELITISLVELRPDEADRAFARTRERWKLVRVEAGGKRVSAQETVYDEEYVLVRANGRWLIESNPFTVVTTISQ